MKRNYDEYYVRDHWD